jgi:hypothetical protein
MLDYLSRVLPPYFTLQASYMVLDQGISPVTFSVGNTMKRVAVVVSSVMFFKNPVSAMNWVSPQLLQYLCLPWAEQMLCSDQASMCAQPLLSKHQAE